MTPGTPLRRGLWRHSWSYGGHDCGGHDYGGHDCGGHDYGASHREDGQ